MSVWYDTATTDIGRARVERYEGFCHAAAVTLQPLLYEKPGRVLVGYEYSRSRLQSWLRYKRRFDELKCLSYTVAATV